MPKVVILAGGLGTRLSEETKDIPKPMVEIGGMPIIWHIMKTYSHYGFNEFIICGGYKSYVIKKFFQNYFLYSSDVTFEFLDGENKVIHNTVAEPWKVTIVDTGLDTMTGGRIKRIRDYIGDDEYFLATYGDGIGDININALVDFHRKNNKVATMTSVARPTNFGVIKANKDGLITTFKEKPKDIEYLTNAGFFVFSKEVFDYIDNDTTVLEQEPLRNLCNDEQLQTYFHKDFWHPMDTLRDKNILNKLWNDNEAKWKIWD